nr:c-type cytochrome [Deltaproteobacteria bacterium]
LLSLFSCGEKSAPPPPEAVETWDVVEARQTFHSLCATCHGESGTGDGIAAATLNPKPRNYTDKTWQASVTDDQIRSIILNGGASVGKSAAMPASPQFKDRPGVIDELVRIVRSFGK